ncbi:hypothetical protein EUV02_03680 [Polymorphobacter arshaanensis]|uniref:ATLF-like domain-containing protein n=1 Tax=Glacieibacterium arshaanense TaxID=2511025 RepID=A0A4Y9ER71_9SPHN|nr:hypothetical protein [Polymorphobacter arshaanensis]TFU06126.1 hypothetical protein EUV02_03680 [Polymorphobacter arshaanensis]
MPTDLDKLLGLGGSADASDLAAVRPAAAQLPPQVLSFLRMKGARIIVCRGSITDHAKDLKGVQPRGWPAGMTWDIVPGVYLPNRKQVVVATLPMPGGRRLPVRGEGHGSFNLLLHETMHGHDFLKNHRLLGASKFVAARTADFAKLGSYEQQAGDAGLQETYAESAARAFGRDTTLPAAWPQLAKFWALLDPGQLQLAPETIEEAPPRRRIKSRRATPVGTAQVHHDGSIELNLRADAGDGAIGHALVTIKPGSARYGEIASHLTGAPQGLVPQALAPSGPMVVKPF